MKHFSDETVICRCTGVTCGEIKKVFSPEKTLQQIIDETVPALFAGDVYLPFPNISTF